LEIASFLSTNARRAYLLKNVPSFKTYILQKHILTSIYRSAIPSPHGLSLSAFIPLPVFHSFGWSKPGAESLSKNCLLNNNQRALLAKKFQEFSSPLIGNSISIYIDGSKSDDSPVGAAIYSSELGIALKHKLPSDTSIFSAEAWAIYQALILAESSQNKKSTIFCDSKSVLEALSSHQKKSCTNYLIPLCRSKYHSLTCSNFIIDLVWIPSHVGIPGNERTDSFARQAALNGRKPKFKVSYTDYCSSSSRDLREKTSATLKECFSTKGKHFYLLYCNGNLPSHLWFSQLSIPRKQILIIRLRSNHYKCQYNLNASLYRKNIVSSASCNCGDPYQDANHIIFYCPQTRPTASHLIAYLRRISPFAPINIFPFLHAPSLKLCRLIASFFKSSQILIWREFSLFFSPLKIIPPLLRLVTPPPRQLFTPGIPSTLYQLPSRFAPVYLGTRARGFVLGLSLGADVLRVRSRLVAAQFVCRLCECVPVSRLVIFRPDLPVGIFSFGFQSKGVFSSYERESLGLLSECSRMQGAQASCDGRGSGPSDPLHLLMSLFLAVPLSLSSYTTVSSKRTTKWLPISIIPWILT